MQPVASSSRLSVACSFALAVSLGGTLSLGCKDREPSAEGTAHAPASVVPSAAPSPSASVAPPSAAPTSATGQAQGLLDPSVAPSFGEPTRVGVVPPVPVPERGKDSMDHAFVAGWSKDGAEFGYCMTDGGLGATRCQLMKPDGKLEQLTDRAQAQGEDIDPALTKSIKARIRERGYGVSAPEWPYAGDLVIAWAVKKPAAPDKPPSLEVGARLRNATSLTPTMVLTPPPVPGATPEVHPEVIALSPDGKYLGVVSHAFHGEFTDRFEVKVAPTALVAGQAYNDAGLAQHREKHFKEAALLFHKAAYANPESKVAMYNLACALAQLGDPGTQKALSLAIEQGGEATRAKARTDADFANVRNEPWFAELTAPNAKKP